MELPEKIFIDSPNHDFWYRTKNNNSTEYIRKDVVNYMLEMSLSTSKAEIRKINLIKEIEDKLDFYCDRPSEFYGAIEKMIKKLKGDIDHDTRRS